MPFIRVAGDMTIALNSGSVNTAAEIEFPKLQEIGGTLTLGTNRNANNITFPLLKKILGSCSVTTYKLKNDIEFIDFIRIHTGLSAGNKTGKFNNGNFFAIFYS